MRIGSFSRPFSRSSQSVSQSVTQVSQSVDLALQERGLRRLSVLTTRSHMTASSLEDEDNDAESDDGESQSHLDMSLVDG